MTQVWWPNSLLIPTFGPTHWLKTTKTWFVQGRVPCSTDHFWGGSYLGLGGDSAKTEKGSFKTVSWGPIFNAWISWVEHTVSIREYRGRPQYSVWILWPATIFSVNILATHNIQWEYCGLPQYWVRICVIHTQHVVITQNSCGNYHHLPIENNSWQ